MSYGATGSPNVRDYREQQIVINYKGNDLPSTYRVDFLCYDEVLVELKSLPRITNIERAQVINYLKASGFRVALIINFGTSSLEYERLVL